MSERLVLFKDTVVATPAELIELEDMLLATQFNLPGDVLRNATARGWVIHPIEVVSQEQWRKAYPHLQAGVSTGEITSVIAVPPSWTLIKACKYVGIALRENKKADKYIVIVKPWLGAVYKKGQS